MVASHALNEIQEAGAMVPFAAHHGAVPGGSSRHLHTPASFAGLQAGGLFYLVKDMKRIASKLGELDGHLRDGMQEIPKAIMGLKQEFGPATGDVTQAIKDTVDDAKLVREKIDIFNERIDESLKRAMKFNALITRQNDYMENKLEPEILEMSGAVLSQLNRAKELGTNLLAKDAEELVKVSNEQKLAYTQEASIGPLPTALLLLAERDASEARVRLSSPSGTVGPTPAPTRAGCESEGRGERQRKMMVGAWRDFL